MKRLILAAGLFAATLTASLHAQTMNLRATIPFDFQIGDTAFPSGEYSIRHSNGVLVVSQASGGHKSGMFMTVGEGIPHASKEQGTLQFNRYGDSCYLSKVWALGTADAQAPMKSKREKELASHIGRSGTTTVSLR
ncbi:MAG: hypothetical protein ABI833_17300 [Acidobacteriota bacterium]